MPPAVSTFLLEIGTEELPADFARLALPQLEEMVSDDLREARLKYGLITCTSTPRRIALLVHDLATNAKDFEEDRKGPPAEQAFKNGSRRPSRTPQTILAPFRHSRTKSLIISGGS